LPSVIRIISKAWNSWLIIGPKVKRHALNAEREAGTLPFRSKGFLGKGRRPEIIGAGRAAPYGCRTVRGGKSQAAGTCRRSSWRAAYYIGSTMPYQAAACSWYVWVVKNSRRPYLISKAD
jgi:hypothetical protein